jgi:hypothetical protein
VFRIHRPVTPRVGTAPLATREVAALGGRAGRAGVGGNGVTGLCVWKLCGMQGRVGGVGEFGADCAERLANGSECSAAGREAHGCDVRSLYAK